MSISAAISANQILTRVAVECGLNVAADPIGSELQEYIQLKALLQVAGEDLCLAYPWEFLSETLTIISDGTTEEHALPSDYLSLTDQTGWNKTLETRVVGSLSPQEWRALKAGTFASTDSFFRLAGGKILLYPIPAAGDVVEFEYLSRFFVKEDTGSGTRKESITTGSDIVIFDRTLISRYLKVMWLEAKGFDTGAAQNSFNQTFSFLTSKDTAGKFISPVRQSSFRLLDAGNIPDTRYGL